MVLQGGGGRVMIEYGRVGVVGKEALANVGLPLADGFASNCVEAIDVWGQLFRGMLKT